MYIYICIYIYLDIYIYIYIYIYMSDTRRGDTTLYDTIRRDIEAFNIHASSGAPAIQTAALQCFAFICKCKLTPLSY